MTSACTRRRFLGLLPAAAAAAATVLGSGRAAAAWLPASDHPDPRPGIDARNVLRADQLQDAPHVISLYDSAREIPHILDGIRCYCGCAVLEGYRSLLVCYEEGGMSKYCDICQGQGRLAHRRWKEGQSLQQIRRAIDARYASALTHSPVRHAHADHCGGTLPHVSREDE